MEDDDNGRCIFQLTNLQIGDLQTYLSHLSLFLATDSGKLYILVDNRPWLKDLVSRPTHLWQLMVTKSRLSPFANTRGKKGRKMTGEFLDLPSSSSTPNTSKSRNFKKWFSLVDTASLSRDRAILPVKKLRNSLIANSKLHRTLYGFIVFEVLWSDVRGLNYMNELQTDTSLAIEAKSMRRWEFDSIRQAARCISSWFTGTLNEQIILKEFLDDALGEVFHDAQECFPKAAAFDHHMFGGDESPNSSNFRIYPSDIRNNRTDGLHTPPPPYKRRKLMKSMLCDSEQHGIYSSDPETVEILSQDSDCEEIDESTLYKNVLISIRFDDRDLPFKLKKIIMSNLRLLTLLESGLPSWVIFLQSYPVFCHFYRPWMCPLARAFYVLISIVTVLIGFYDLYKNVPLLKATASGLFGPLFDWIETWEMISRIKYLGTMLFFHNFKKAIKWLLMVSRGVRSFLSILAEPMTGPFADLLDFFLPFWSVCVEIAESLFSVTWMVIESSFTMIGDLIEFLLLPLWYILTFMGNVAKCFLYPIFWILCEIVYAPFRLVLGLYSLVSVFSTCMYDFVGEVCVFVSSIFQFSRGVKSTVSSYEVSVWRSLWNDLFSHVFRALRSILNGLVAFFTACNRHRLSIYNHSREFIQRLSRASKKAAKSSEESSDSHLGSESQITPKDWRRDHQSYQQMKSWQQIG